ncbi:Na+/H+ antiporter subunit E [Chloroflexota bacterium]
MRKRCWQGRLPCILTEFALLFIFWLVLSGHFDITYVLLGVFSSALITILTNDLFSSLFTQGRQGQNNFLLSSPRVLSFLAYLPWLLFRIIQANLQVAYLVLHPRMPIRPGLLRFRTGIRSHLAQVMLANSITLTPGTVTVDLEDGEYVVHALVPESAERLLEAKIQNQIGQIFREEKDLPPRVRWLASLKELKE